MFTFDLLQLSYTSKRFKHVSLNRIKIKISESDDISDKYK